LNKNAIPVLILENPNQKSVVQEASPHQERVTKRQRSIKQRSIKQRKVRQRKGPILNAFNIEQHQRQVFAVFSEHSGARVSLYDEVLTVSDDSDSILGVLNRFTVIYFEHVNGARHYFGNKVGYSDVVWELVNENLVRIFIFNSE
jgi:hypothetical protein